MPESSINPENAEASSARAIKVILPLKWRKTTHTSWSPYGSAAEVDDGYDSGRPGRELEGGYLDKHGVGALANESKITTTEFGTWNTTGTATLRYQVCKLASGFGYSWRAAQDSFFAQFYNLIHWYYTGTAASYRLVEESLEVDFNEVMNQLRLQYSPHVYYVVAARLASLSGEDDTEVGISLETLNGIYSDDGAYIIPEDQKINPTQNLYGDEYGGGLIQPSYDQELLMDGVSVVEKFNPETSSFTPLSGTYTSEEFGQAVGELAVGSCMEDSKIVSTSMIFWLLEIPTAHSVASPGSPGVSLASDKDSPDNASYSSGNSISGGTGSQSVKAGNTVIPFNAVTVVGESYNAFEDAGGGIITEDGDIYPLSEAIYADKIDIGIEGSSATIIEPVEFDEEPTLPMYKKVYIYLLDATNTNTPVMCGYIINRSRTLSSNGQQIEYEVRDLTFFLNQSFTPSYYVYRPAALDGAGTVKTYAKVLKEILNLAGFSDAVLNLPEVASPAVNWVYRPITEVVEWATKLFGKYVYWVDKSGRLNIGPTDGGSFIKSYRIPTKGEAVGTHKVLSFKPIADFTRSRSRVILTGDFELTEFKTTQVLENVGDELYFRPGHTLITHLLSKPADGPRAVIIRRFYPFTIEGHDYYAPSIVDKDIPIAQISTQPGDSYLYLNDPAVSFYSRTEWWFNYAVQSDAPIQVSVDTGLDGGTEVINRPEFKKINCEGLNLNDLSLMQKYLILLKDFYRPIYGGTLELDGLDTDLVLLGKVSITNTALPSKEAANLIVYGINYDVSGKRTTVSLSNKVYNDLPFFDPVRERSRDKNETLVKVGMLETTELYKKV